MTVPSWSSARAFAAYCWRRFHKDDCLGSAAELTYLSLFALVPLMTVAYAMLSAVPAFAAVGAQLQDFIFAHFVPDTGRQLQTYLRQFSEQARNLTGLGVVFLVITALTMMSSIEKTFNAIWRTRNSRSGLSSFLLYWAVLSLGPLLIGVAIGISTYVLSLQVLFDRVHLFGARAVLFALAPPLLISAAFTLLFAAVPNCRVPLKHALIGGFVSGFAFELARHAFASVMANASYEFIYGTFAAIPLFLLWLFLSWVIVLAGAELVQALSGYDSSHTRPLPDLILALAVLERLWRKHREGEALSEDELLHQRWLLGRHRLSTERWAVLRERLLDAGLINCNDRGGFLLGRDLHHYRLWDLCEQLRLVPQPMKSPAETTPWLATTMHDLNALRATGEQQLQIPLADLFAQSDDGGVSHAP